MTSRAADFRRSSAPPLDEQLGAKQHERTNLIAYRHGLRSLGGGGCLRLARARAKGGDASVHPISARESRALKSTRAALRGFLWSFLIG